MLNIFAIFFENWHIIAWLYSGTFLLPFFHEENKKMHFFLINLACHEPAIKVRIERCKATSVLTEGSNDLDPTLRS
jgi:hypothetical protein